MLQNATVEFSRTIKPADYESKNCKVILTGIVNSDADLDKLAHIAHEQLVKMLGMPDRQIMIQPPVVPIPKANRPETIPPMPKANGAADPFGGVSAVMPPSGALAGTPVNGATAPSNSGQTATSSASPSDDFISPAVVEITNEQIKEHCLAKSQELQAAGKQVVAIRNVIGSFVEPPKTAYDIPQDQRAAFLAKIAAL